MAHYNPTTDEIHGAEPGTWEYLHEERHREQYQRGVAQKADQMHILLYYASFIAAPVGLVFAGKWGFFLGVGVAMTPHVLALAALELDAYVVGTFRYLKRRRVWKSKK